MRIARFLAFVCTPIAIGACGSSGSGSTGAPQGTGPTASLFVVPASLDQLVDDHWYDLPWPNDLRRDPDGTIRVAGFYNPRLIPLLDQYIGDAKGLLKGFSPVASGYMRFTGDLDPSTLPANPQATLDAGASVQILDVDPASPEHGKRKLAQTYWRNDDGVYWFKDTLAVGPAFGWALREKTKYAIVVTNKVRTVDGKP